MNKAVAEILVQAVFKLIEKRNIYAARATDPTKAVATRALYQSAVRSLEKRIANFQAPSTTVAPVTSGAQTLKATDVRLRLLKAFTEDEETLAKLHGRRRALMDIQSNVRLPAGTRAAARQESTEVLNSIISIKNMQSPQARRRAHDIIFEGRALNRQIFIKKNNPAWSRFDINTATSAEHFLRRSVRNLPGVKLDNIDVRFVSTQNRGSANLSRGTMSVRRGSVSNAVHEFTHHIEYRNYAMYKKVVKFRDSRLKVGERPRRLKDLMPNYNFRTTEYAYEDEFGRFTGPYAGKVYPDATTEILTMGMESLYSNPVGFARKDPEYFEFILQVVTGMG